MKADSGTRSRAYRTEKGGFASRFSITAKITIWYALFFMLIAIILATILVRLYDDRIKSAAENKLVRVVDEVGDVISDDGDDFILDKKISYYYKDSYISLYELDGDLITGRLPRGIDSFPPINIDEIQMTEDSSGSEWYCYDSKIDVGGRNLYIRGMLNNIAEDDKYSFSNSLALVMLPIIIILAGLGGYLITKSAFAPVRNIINATDDISRDGDLSRRIPLGRSHDEIYELSESFNNVFDRVEELVNREKQFTADVSHELRTPLAVIQTQSEFAMEDESYAPEAVKVINRESRSMSELIRRLLMIARSDAGRMMPDIKEVDVSDLLTEVAEIKRPVAEEAGQKLLTDIPDGITAHTDEEMLLRIIINLVNNAIKYGRVPGGTIMLSAERTKAAVICRVSDDGDGIAAEEREKIWERFYRADESRSSDKSAGIGLSIVKALANAIGADVELLSDDESELGGASFELRVPEAVHQKPN